jgi:transposase-like protein
VEEIEICKPASKKKYFSTYSEINMQEAIAEIQSKKINIRQAAKKFQVPKSTLHNFILPKRHTHSANGRRRNVWTREERNGKRDQKMEG